MHHIVFSRTGTESKAKIKRKKAIDIFILDFNPENINVEKEKEALTAFEKQLVDDFKILAEKLGVPFLQSENIALTNIMGNCHMMFCAARGEFDQKITEQKIKPECWPEYQKLISEATPDNIPTFPKEWFDLVTTPDDRWEKAATATQDLAEFLFMPWQSVYPQQGLIIPDWYWNTIWGYLTVLIRFGIREDELMTTPQIEKRLKDYNLSLSHNSIWRLCKDDEIFHVEEKGKYKTRVSTVIRYRIMNEKARKTFKSKITVQAEQE